ncbi:MAG: flavodoxin domain-containing protein [Haloarculaceae archaeon]
MASRLTDDSEVLIAYYSRTGTTETLAEQLAATLPEPTTECIMLLSERRYLNWLCRSFVPGWGVNIEPPDNDPQMYDAVFLGVPKWTVNCPPITTYMSEVSMDSLPVGLFVTYGGFDEQRYVRALAEQLTGLGAETPAWLLVQRDRVQDISLEDVERFCDAVLEAV